jgi:hypothetical protein
MWMPTMGRDAMPTMSRDAMPTMSRDAMPTMSRDGGVQFAPALNSRMTMNDEGMNDLKTMKYEGDDETMTKQVGGDYKELNATKVEGDYDALKTTMWECFGDLKTAAYTLTTASQPLSSRCGPSLCR